MTPNNKLKSKVGLSLFLLSFLVYFSTVPPTITSYGDSSELITSAFTFTTAHPPGYPLYIIVGKLFTLLPWGTVAWRVHLSSAIFGSLTVLLVFSSLHLLTKNLFVSTLATTPLAFSHSFWLYHITAEVFSLNNLMAALVIYNILLWREKTLSHAPSPMPHLYLSFFFLGLGLANHYSIILVAPGVLFIILMTKKAILLRKFLKLSFVFILGLLPYLQIIYAARQPHPPAYGNLPSFSRFLAYILRLDYGGPISAGAIISPPQQAPDTFYYFKLFSNQFTPLAFLIIVLGLWLVYKKARWFKLFPFILYLFSGPFVWSRYLTQIDPTDLHVLGVAERFSLLSFIPFALCLGVSLTEIMRFYHLRGGGIAPLKRGKGHLGGVLVILLITSFQILRTLPHVSKRNYYLAKNYALNILNQIEDNAIILSTDDLTNSSLDYFTQVEKIKPEIIILSSAFLSNKEYQKEIRSYWPDLFTTDSQYEYDIIRDIIKTNQGKRPVYFIMLDDPYPLGFNENPYRFRPQGLLLLAKTELVMSEIQDEIESIDWWQKYNLEGLNQTYKDPFAQLTVATYAFRQRINAQAFMEHLNIFSQARKEAEASLKLNPSDQEAQKIKEKLETEYKDWTDDFRPKTDVDYGLTSEEHFQKAQAMAQTPSLIENFNMHRAVYEAQIAINKDKQNGPAYGLLATLYEYFNCFKDAAKEYQQALKLNPENKELKERLIRLERYGLI